MEGRPPLSTPPPCGAFSSPPFTVMISSPSASTCFISSPTTSPDLYGVSTYCVTDGARNNSSNEWCNIRIDQNVTLHRAFFDAERGFDWMALYAPGVTVPASRPFSTPSFAWSDNGHPPLWVNASEGSRLIWSTNKSFARGGDRGGAGSKGAGGGAYSRHAALRRWSAVVSTCMHQGAYSRHAALRRWSAVVSTCIHQGRLLAACSTVVSNTVPYLAVCV